MKIDKMMRHIRDEVMRRKIEVTRDSLARAQSPGPAAGAVQQPSRLDVDEVMRKVRESVMTMRASEPAAVAASDPQKLANATPPRIEPVPLSRLSSAGERIAAKDAYALADFLQFHDDDFVRNAYRGLLRREVDPEGHAGSLAALRSGQLAKTDILGQIRYSAEGKSLGVTVDGLALPYALRTLRRVPVFGRIIGILQYIARLPDVVRNHERLEATLFHRESELRRQFDLAQAQIERLLMRSTERADHAQREINTRLDDVRARMFTASEAQDLRRRQIENAEAIRAALALQATLSSREQALRAEMDERLEALGIARAEVEQRFSAVERALERKAEGERVTALTNHLTALIRTRSEQKALEEMGHRVDVLAASKADTAILHSVQQAVEVRMQAAHAEVRTVDAATRELRGAIDKLAVDKVDRRHVEAVGQKLEEAFSALRLATGDLARLESMIGDMREPYLQVRSLTDSLASTKADRAEVERIDQIVSELRTLRTADTRDLESSLSSVQGDLADQRRILLDQHRRVVALADEWRTRVAKTGGALIEAPSESVRLFDQLYASFENRFRGSPHEIKERVSIYLPRIEQVRAGTVAAPVVDLGCGRGDWLSLLQESGLVGTGVDVNTVNVADCRSRGLDVVASDAIEYLRGREDGSIGAITAMHVIEHMPFSQMILLIDEAHRVLRAGGVLILETPNPENVLVGSCNFWFDPTHQRPLPPATVNFFVEARGFSPVEILRLHPYPESEQLSEGAPGVISRINQAFYSAQDYAVVAIKGDTRVNNDTGEKPAPRKAGRGR